MEFLSTYIDGVFIIKPKVIKDERGYFFESFSEREFNENVEKIDFVQDNQSKSCYGVVRGLHFQKGEYAQSKLVRCVKGEILDVAVDLRKNSPTYGKYVSAVLSENNHQQLFIPRGFAHGFSVLSEEAIVQYKCDNFYNKESEGGINSFDENLNIEWGVPKDKVILSEKDLKWQKLTMI
jgi:dTDP-4-dehydrorhamnose 3,5-epimerase